MLMQFADANSAAGHLLRHLHDARALRHNPLVAHVFAEQERAGEPPSAALARVHEIVTVTATRIFGGETTMGRGLVPKARQLEIIMRCDIRGDLHKAVQTDMGLGARQFYRERLRARSQLAKALEALVPTKLTEPEATLDPHGLAIASIRAARMRADDTFAIELIRKELGRGVDPPRRLELLAILGETLGDAGEFAEARNAIATAEGLGLDDDYSSGRLLQVQAEVACLEGCYLAAARLCDAAIGRYERLPLPHSVEYAEQLASTLLLASLAKHSVGQYEDALAALQAARELIERRPELPLVLKVQLLENLGASQMVLPGSRSMVESQLLEARSLAQRNGLVREAVACTFYLSTLHEMNGENELALEIGREALELAQRVNGRAVYAWYCLSFARRELDHGYYDNVVRLARTIRACNDSDVSIALANVLEAEALLHLEDPERAYVLTLAAIETLRRADHTRFLGNALRVASEAAFRAGRIEYARYAIQEALALIERYGHPVSLGRARHVQEEINGTAITVSPLP